nr:unnamed protein product [Digitaria exilis]
MAFLFGAFLGLLVGVAVVMAFARLENTRAEQRRELPVFLRPRSTATVAVQSGLPYGMLPSGSIMFPKANTIGVVATMSTTSPSTMAPWPIDRVTSCPLSRGFLARRRLQAVRLEAAVCNFLVRRRLQKMLHKMCGFQGLRTEFIVLLAGVAEPNTPTSTFLVERKRKLKWLNQELVKIWPFVNEAASELIKTSVEPVFEQYKSFILASLHFSKLTLGTVAPQFTAVGCCSRGTFVASSGSSPAQFVTVRRGSPELPHVTDLCNRRPSRRPLLAGRPFVPRSSRRPTSVACLVVICRGILCPSWGPNSVARLVVARHGILCPLPVSIIAVKCCYPSVRCSSCLLVVNSFRSSLPSSSVYVSSSSKVEFTLKVIGGEMTAIPGISDAIEGTIRDTIEDTLTWPNRIIVPIVPGDYSDLELKPVGVLEVKLVEARDLKNKDLVGKSDPFANNDLNPIWNEHYEFVVEDTSTQHLTVKIYDDEGLQASEIIGCARVDLADLQPGKVKDLCTGLGCLGHGEADAFGGCIAICSGGGGLLLGGLGGSECSLADVQPSRGTAAARTEHEGGGRPQLGPMRTGAESLCLPDGLAGADGWTGGISGKVKDKDSRDRRTRWRAEESHDGGQAATSDDDG